MNSVYWALTSSLKCTGQNVINWQQIEKAIRLEKRESNSISVSSAWSCVIVLIWLAVAGMALYLLSPVDFIPDVVPIFGVVDDLVLIPLAIRYVLRKLPAAVRADIGHVG